jgi:ferritin-like metal-binding protein YciE
MKDPSENILDWLRDAHAMEQQAEQMLKAQASRLENYPKLRARIEEHLQETLTQRQLVEGCIQRLGGSTSTVKDIAAKLVAFGQSIGGIVTTDEVVKGAMSGYVFENVEIAAYTSLVAAAREIGDAETARICGEICAQELSMAQWLLEHLPEVTQTYLMRAASDGDTAKR